MNFAMNSTLTTASLARPEFQGAPRLSNGGPGAGPGNPGAAAAGVSLVGGMSQFFSCWLKQCHRPIWGMIYCCFTMFYPHDLPL